MSAADNQLRQGIQIIEEAYHRKVCSFSISVSSGYARSALNAAGRRIAT
jgi:hypothetical protein